MIGFIGRRSQRFKSAVKRGSVWGLGVLLLGSGAVSALSAGDGAPAALTPRGLPKIHGSEVKRTTDKLLSEVHWHRDLEHALALAKEEGKPVFWLQLVGELDDGL